MQAAIEAHSVDASGQAIVAQQHFDAALDQIHLKQQYLDQLRQDEKNKEAHS
ncbi:MAG: hypothetical protein ACYCW6_28280 [Candidatus Xenobia bacterium]